MTYLVTVLIGSTYCLYLLTLLTEKHRLYLIILHTSCHSLKEKQHRVAYKICVDGLINRPTDRQTLLPIEVLSQLNNIIFQSDY